MIIERILFSGNPITLIIPLIIFMLYYQRRKIIAHVSNEPKRNWYLGLLNARSKVLHWSKKVGDMPEKISFEDDKKSYVIDKEYVYRDSDRDFAECIIFDEDKATPIMLGFTEKIIVPSATELFTALHNDIITKFRLSLYSTIIQRIYWMLIISIVITFLFLIRINMNIGDITPLINSAKEEIIKNAGAIVK